MTWQKGAEKAFLARRTQGGDHGVRKGEHIGRTEKNI